MVLHHTGNLKEHVDTLMSPWTVLGWRLRAALMPGTLQAKHDIFLQGALLVPQARALN
ncbi:MAG TPA: hypothetical protein PKX28_05665 [Candidatus Hydrogenedentes bacterium]|nr:hypothetical protein [Candidatus Hydrogenedentota bacterium]